MNDIQIFNHEQFGEIRICSTEGKEWFCLSDVCKALDIHNVGNAKSRLSKGGVRSMDTPVVNQYGNAYKQPMTYIDEPNLYRCIFQSRKKEAEQFQNWVFEVVLPQIRKTGGYIPVSEVDDEATMMARALLIAQRTIEQKNQLLEKQRPKVQYADRVLLSPTCYTMTEVAKSLSLTVQELQEWLQRERVMFRSPSGQWMLYSRYQKHGYEGYRTKTSDNVFSKVIHSSSYLVWTEKGKALIHRLYTEREQNIPFDVNKVIDGIFKEEYIRMQGG